jgi:hypothetical protein
MNGKQFLGSVSDSLVILLDKFVHDRRGLDGATHDVVVRSFETRTMVHRSLPGSDSRGHMQPREGKAPAVPWQSLMGVCVLPLTVCPSLCHRFNVPPTTDSSCICESLL